MEPEALQVAADHLLNAALSTTLHPGVRRSQHQEGKSTPCACTWSRNFSEGCWSTGSSAGSCSLAVHLIRSLVVLSVCGLGT